MPGFYCPEGSISPTEKLCGDADKYCPGGNFKPITVTPGYFSIGKELHTRILQLVTVSLFLCLVVISRREHEFSFLSGDCSRWPLRFQRSAVCLSCRLLWSNRRTYLAVLLWSMCDTRVLLPRLVYLNDIKFDTFFIFMNFSL